MPVIMVAPKRRLFGAKAQGRAGRDLARVILLSGLAVAMILKKHNRNTLERKEPTMACEKRSIPTGCVFISIVAFVVFSAWNPAIAAKTWTEGETINTPVISSPSNGANYGINSVITCSCNTPTDSDDWTEPPCNSGSSPDAAIKATWSDNGAGGSWEGSNVGNSVKYVAPGSTGSVTLTVTFDDTGTIQYDDDPDPPKTASVTVQVVDVKMIFKVGTQQTSQITRALTGSFQVVKGDGQPLSGAMYSNWMFAGGGLFAQDPSNTSDTWSGMIVAPGFAACRVQLGSNFIWASKLVTVLPRNWSLSPSCTQDNDPTWGEYPGAVTLGRNRDRVHQSGEIIWPRANGFRDGYTVEQVANGPNKGFWYIKTCSFAVDRETLINKFVKPGATGYPDPPGVGWHEYNENHDVDADAFLQGVKNHEAYGTSGNRKGHQALIEDEEAKPGMDVKAKVEDNVDGDTSSLHARTYLEVSAIDAALAAAAVESNIPPGSNWEGDVYQWNADGEVWLSGHKAM